jgi:hypothetical protein
MKFLECFVSNKFLFKLILVYNITYKKKEGNLAGDPYVGLIWVLEVSTDPYTIV